MSEKLTKKQKQIIEFISTFQKENNYSPSYREIMSGLGLSSVSAVAEHIENLVGLGVLKKTQGAARSLEIVAESNPETVALFNKKLNSADLTEEEIEILLKSAEILGINLE